MSNFICANCGRGLYVRVVSVNEDFSKEDFIKMEEKEDYADMYLGSYDYLQIECSGDCGKASLTPEDTELMEGHFEDIRAI